VGRSRKYCNSGPTRGGAGASPYSPPLFEKISLTFEPLIGGVSDVKLIRTDTTLDLSH